MTRLVNRIGFARVSQVALLVAAVLFVLGPSAANASTLKYDPSFNGGIVMPHIAGPGLDQYWGDVIAEPDGRYVIAFAYQEHRPNRATGDVTMDVALVRLNHDGSLDPSFGTRGIARANIVGKRSLTMANAFALTRDSLGRYVMVGMTQGHDSPRSDTLVRTPYVMRFNHNGRRDKAFGDRGFTRLEVRDLVVYAQASEVSIVGRETILVSGFVGLGRGDHFAARLRPNGALDRRFGNGGITRIGVSNRSHDEPGDMVVQRNGRIVLCGTSYVRSARRWFASFVGLTPQGQLDRTFGNGGRQFADVGQRRDLMGVTRCALTSEDGIIAASTRDDGDSKVVLFKLSAGGTIDGDFAGGRGINADVQLESAESDIAILPDSTVLVSGYNPTYNSGCFIFGYTSSGQSDEDFGFDESPYRNLSRCNYSPYIPATPLTGAAGSAKNLTIDSNGAVLAGVTLRPRDDVTGSNTIALVRMVKNQQD